MKSYGTNQVAEETMKDQNTAFFSASTNRRCALKLDQANDRDPHSSVSTDNQETDDVPSSTDY